MDTDESGAAKPAEAEAEVVAEPSSQNGGVSLKESDSKPNGDSNIQNESNSDSLDLNSPEAKEDAPQATIMIDIPRIQWFIIKNDQRKQIAGGNVQIVTHPKKTDLLVFTFPENRDISYVLCKQHPCLKMYDNNYVFTSTHEFFGLYIDPTNSLETIEKFEQIVKEFSFLKISARSQEIHQLPENLDLYVGPPDKIALVGDKLAAYIRKGTVVVSRGIRRSAQSASSGLHRGKDRLKERISPRPEPARVSPATQSRLMKMQMGAQAVVKVSGAILTGTMAAANVLSNEISDAILDTELGRKMSERSGPKTKAAKDLVKSSISGVVTVYDEVVNAGLQLVRETGSVTADVVGHKYGDEAKRAAESTSNIVDSAAQSVVNINRLGVKALAKRVTANTTVDLLSDETEKKENRDARVAIDPMTGMQALMAANQVAGIKDKYSEQSRLNRQNFVGLEPWGQSSDNIDDIDNINNNIENSGNGNEAPVVLDDVGARVAARVAARAGGVATGAADEIGMDLDVEQNGVQRQDDIVMGGVANGVEPMNGFNGNAVNNGGAPASGAEQVDSIFEQDVFDVD